MNDHQPERILKSWDAFADLARRLSPKGDEPFPGAFRGHANASWRLEPTLLRLLREARITNEEEALDLERRALSLFQSGARSLIAEDTRAALTDMMSWWTLMQHHGYPTRLLDWSVSIYVAAYFAVSSHPECDGALWILNNSIVPAAMEKRYGPSPFPTTVEEIRRRFSQPAISSAVHFFQRRRPHERMAAQHGLFSVCENVLADHAEILHGATPENLFRKYIIPVAQKRQFLMKLAEIDFTASALFPGLDGLARSIGEMLVCNTSPTAG